MNNCRTYGYPKSPVNEVKNHGRDQQLSAFPEKVSVAMAYVPFQQSNEVYDIDTAFLKGTVFTVLDKPFHAGCGG